MGSLIVSWLNHELELELEENIVNRFKKMLQTKKNCFFYFLLFTCSIFFLSTPVFAEATKLTICEWEGYIMPWEKEFKAYAKERGLEVDLELYPEYLSNPERVYFLSRGKKCDVMTPTHNYFAQKNDQLFKTLIPIDYSRIPNYADVFPALKKLKYKEYKGNNYAVPLLGGSYGLAYNADKVEKPTSMDVLFDPANRCKTTLTKDQYAANLYMAIIKAGYDAGAVYDVQELAKISNIGGIKDPKIQKNLNALYANVCTHDRFWEGMADFSKPDLLYGTTYWFGVAEAQKNGLNWKIAHGVPTTVWLDTISFVASIKDSPKKLKAAYMLADFMISVPIQEKIHQSYGSVVVNQKAKQVMSDLSGFYIEKWLWKPLAKTTHDRYRRMHKIAFRSLPQK